jgi:glucuronokinase
LTAWRGFRFRRYYQTKAAQPDLMPPNSTAIRTSAFARAGLIGNPSDGYNGKTISFIVGNFSARVELEESSELEIVPNERDHRTFRSIDHLVADVAEFGYYGGLRLLKATVKCFYHRCLERGVTLRSENFRLRYHSTIPVRVGMAGSSAIITATMRALMQFHGVTEKQFPKQVLPSDILAVERGELGIPAGLQDRVIQVYQGCVYMDFDKEHMDRNNFGIYEELDPKLLPPLYVAFNNRLGEGTEVPHSNIRERFLRGDPEVLDAMEEWADLARQTRDLLAANRGGEIAPLLNRNFDLRRKIYGAAMSAGNIDMVEAARGVGASAKFAGSGGAIVGTYDDEAMFLKLSAAMKPLGAEVIKPMILPEK